MHDELLAIDEVLARVDAVTVEDVRVLAAELFAQPQMLAVVGPEGGTLGWRSGVPQAIVIAAPAQATAHSTLVKVPMMNRSAAPVGSRCAAPDSGPGPSAPGSPPGPRASRPPG